MWALFYGTESVRARMVPVPFICSARGYYTRDDVDVDYWISRQRTVGGVIDTEIGREVIDPTFLVCFRRTSRTGRARNLALKDIGIEAEGDLLMMKLESGDDCEVGHLFDVVDATIHLKRSVDLNEIA